MRKFVVPVHSRHYPLNKEGQYMATTQALAPEPGMPNSQLPSMQRCCAFLTVLTKREASHSP